MFISASSPEGEEINIPSKDNDMPWTPAEKLDHNADGLEADLLMRNGKVVRAVWRHEAGTLGNCRGNAGEKTPAKIAAWWPANGGKMIGLYEPISFRVVEAA